MRRRLGARRVGDRPAHRGRARRRIRRRQSFSHRGGRRRAGRRRRRRTGDQRPLGPCPRAGPGRRAGEHRALASRRAPWPPRRGTGHGEGEPGPRRGPDAGRQRGRGPDPARAELTGRRAAHRGRCGDPRLHGHARLGNALVRRLEPARHHPQSLGPGADDGRVVVRRGSGRRGRLRPPQRRHRHRRLDPAARHLAGSGGVQAQLRSRTARHPLPRAGGRSDDPHGRGRGADDVGASAAPTAGTGRRCRPRTCRGARSARRRRPCEGCGSG